MQNGEKINSYVFLYPFEKVNELLGNSIIQFNIEQIDVKKFNINVVLKKLFLSWQNTIEAELRIELNKLGFGDVNWNIKFVKGILPDSSEGKVQFFKNKVKLAQ